MNGRDYPTLARQYAEDVVAGQLDACLWVRLACQRHLDDLERDDWPWTFSDIHASRACKFIELLPHVKGRWARARERIRLEPWQVFIISSLFGWVHRDTALRRFRSAYIEVCRKNAKAEWVENLIPTPAGFKRMGDIQPGDSVFGSDGRPTRVVACTEEMRDRDCMAVTFGSGERVVVAADHLWKVNQRIRADNGRRAWTEKEDDIVRMVYPVAGVNGIEEELPHRSRYALAKRSADLGLSTGGRRYCSVRRLPEPRAMSLPPLDNVLPTAKIKETLTYGKRGDLRYSVDVAPAVEYGEANLTIPPYTLGAWLGDGTSANANITIGYADTGVKDAIEAEGVTCEERPSRNEGSGKYILGRGKNSIQSRLRALGVLDNKHIPECYLRSSFEQRLALLRGLMDTDGSVTQAGQCNFTNCNERLAGDVHELVCSLGMKATLRERMAKLYGRNIRPVFNVSFYPKLTVFGLARKARRQKTTSGKTRTDTRSIAAVNSIGSVPVKCIEVEATDGIYLTSRSFIPTHNSTMAAGIGLYMLVADHEEGAEVYSAATTREQARIVWHMAKRMADRSPGLRARFGVETGMMAIAVPGSDSSFRPLSRDQGGNHDGLNVHCSIVDELHAHKTREMYDVLETATGARDQSLLLNITTAGSDRAGICYEQRTYVTELLNAVALDHPELSPEVKGASASDDSYFGIIYTIDNDDLDHWDDPRVWAKANPNFGISVSPEDLERKARKARARPAALNNFFTKHLDVWVGAHSAWLNMLAWRRQADPDQTLEQHAGRRAWLAVDLASKVDIASLAVLIEDGLHWRLFVKNYCPEEAVEDADNSQYRAWADGGHLIVTEGSATDYETIETDIIELAELLDVQELVFDPWQAQYLVQRLQNRNLLTVELPQNVRNMSEPMKELEKLILTGALTHDGCPVLEWMASNVIAYEDAKGNIYPRKEHPDKKIDGMVASIMALARALGGESEQPSVYEERGIVFL